MADIGRGGMSIGMTPTQRSVLDALGAGLDGDGNITGVFLPRSGTAAALAAVVPEDGEIVLITDRVQYVMGDGSTTVADLLKVGRQGVIRRQTSNAPLATITTTSTTEHNGGGGAALGPTISGFVGQVWQIDISANLYGSSLAFAAATAIVLTTGLHGGAVFSGDMISSFLPVGTYAEGVFMTARSRVFRTLASSSEVLGLWSYLAGNPSAGDLFITELEMVCTPLDSLTTQAA